MTCHLQAGDSGKPGPLRSGDQYYSLCSQTGRARFFLLPPFCSVLAFDGLDDSHPYWGGLSALLSSLIQMLISSQNTFTDKPTVSGGLCDPVKFAHKINHHYVSPVLGT